MSAEHNGRLSFLLFSRLSLRGGRDMTKIITIILSAFSFMLFALGSTGFLYNEVDFATRAYLNYCANRPCIQINLGGNANKFMTQEQVQRIEQTTGLPFVYDSSGFSWSHFIGMPDEREQSEFVNRYWGSGHSSSLGLAGSAEEYQSMGYSLLAGRYPMTENELAISEMHFQAFRDAGYRNAAKNFIWTVVDISGIYHREGYEYNPSIPVEVERIDEYQDIIGKTFGMGDILSDEHAVEYKIVGVVDTQYDRHLAEKLYVDAYYPSGRLMFSEAKKQGLEKISDIYCSPKISDSEMKKLVELTLCFRGEASATDRDYPMPLNITMLLHATSFSGDIMFTTVVSGGGVFFGIFAALLNGHLTTVSLEQKQKKIGILRAMGASQRKVTKIFLFEAFVTATCIFLLALLASLGIFYGWLEPLSTVEAFGVSLLQYNGWTVLILAAICYAVPLLCTIAPLKKFFKKPITDNITGNTMKKIKKR